MEQARELEFGEARRHEAQLAMRSVLGGVEQKPYAGSRLPVGDVLREYEDPAEAARFFGAALREHLTGLGAQIREIDITQSADVLARIDHEAMPEGLNGSAFHYAPWEAIVIAGAVPKQDILHGRRATCQAIEACAELIRVLLATAVVAAAVDCADDEPVVVFLRQLEFGGHVDFERSNAVGIGRARAIVYTRTEPRVSYLLGSSYGMPKPFNLAWQFPLVEQIYGPSRLRWCDRRSPGYAQVVPVEASAAVVVPS